MLGGGGVNQHMENSICFVVFLNESFPYNYLIEFTFKRFLTLFLVNLHVWVIMILKEDCYFII